MRRAVPVAALLACAACSAPREPFELLRLPPPAEAGVNGRGWDWIEKQQGKPLRLHDDVRRTLPAAPPSRLRYVVDIPKGGRLSFACGIPPERHEHAGVEFIVKARRGGDERTLWSELIDPARRPAHRRWVSAEGDLSAYAGRGVDLILETRGFEQTDDARQAFWGAPVVTAPGRAAPLVVVYLVDTLRADHTSVYGYARDTTPELQRLARDAVVFDAAIAHASWTKPSVASLLTSLLPGQHRAVQLRDPLDPGLLTLAEMLQAKGYATGAAIANSVIYSQGSNFEQGFDVFRGLHGAGGRVSKLVEAAGVVDAALEFLDARRGLPAFVYVHTMDPHVPYAPPPPFDRKYEPYPTEEHPALDPRTDYKEPLDRERMIAQYDGDVAYGDQEFGRFVRELKARGLYQDALLVFLADHGEEFLDHGRWLHGRSVFDELIRIPLLVKFPGNRQAGRRVAQQVQEVDVLPTVLAEQKLPVPEPPAIAGRPLQAVLAGGAPEPPALSEISHRGFVAHGMRTRRDKYVQRFSPEEDELYFDLVADPRERTNRLAEARERVRALKAGVEAAMVPNPFRHALRFGGRGTYALELRTRGWIEGVEAAGLGPGESQQLEESGRKLVLRVAPQPGRPREVSFGVRPRGAVVRVSGRRDGRPLRPGDVFVAAEALHPAAVPFALPDIESASESEAESGANVLAPPRTDAPGLHVWLKLIPGRQILDLDPATRERLKALGYLGN